MLIHLFLMVDVTGRSSMDFLALWSTARKGERTGIFGVCRGINDPLPSAQADTIMHLQIDEVLKFHGSDDLNK